MTKDYAETSIGCAGRNCAKHPESGMPLHTKTPAEQAKSEGMKSLSQVSEMTGQSLQTLSNWAKSKPELFRIVLLGCKSKLGA